MRSSTSNSEARFVIAFALTFLVLVGTWEMVLRRYSGESLEFAIDRPEMTITAARGEKWVVFGNCLMMTGVSPKQLDSLLGHGDRLIVNIAAHEQSPLAYFDYLRTTKQYPDVIIANVSSWIRGTNFDQESQRVMTEDPLGLGPHAAAKKDIAGTFQQRVEKAIGAAVKGHVWAIGHRYHLFDVGMAAWTLLRTRDLDNALYQLNIQAWFSVASSDTDGSGYVGIHAAYRSDWPTGLDTMAERYLKRMRLSDLLTDAYWQLLERDVREFQAHGTRVMLVRMPEHPQIRAFNDERYRISQRLRDLEQTTGAPFLDLSTLGPQDGVRLFDSVHPDAAAADVITRRIAEWARLGHLSTTDPRQKDVPGPSIR